jgi:uncharacterized protein (TIGR00661 family)
MARCIFIVQGEGRGHLSQALALKEHLEAAGHEVRLVLVGRGGQRKLPAYFLDGFQEKLEYFDSPYFLRTPNKKGIYVGLTILHNLLRAFRYLKAIRLVRRKINTLAPDAVFNFYDGIGALAMRKARCGIRRIVIGHHFFLHLDGYRCRRGNPLHRWFLTIHTRLVMKGSDLVLALSFRETAGNDRIKVVPPLVRKRFRESMYTPGGRYLIYLLNEGFAADLVAIARADPEFRADLFSDLPADIPVPDGIKLHPISEQQFREKMTTCKGLITTAGFDAVAEAAYLGVPLGVIPVRNHFEQRCNGMDAERSGIGNVLTRLDREGLHSLGGPAGNTYREWVDRAGDMIIKTIMK